MDVNAELDPYNLVLIRLIFRLCTNNIHHREHELSLYVDSGPQDHGWCAGYTCQRRLSLFHSIVALNKPYEVYFTGTSPQNLRLMLLNVDRNKVRQGRNNFLRVVGVDYLHMRTLSPPLFSWTLSALQLMFRDHQGTTENTVV